MSDKKSCRSKSVAVKNWKGTQSLSWERQFLPKVPTLKEWKKKPSKKNVKKRFVQGKMNDRAVKSSDLGEGNYVLVGKSHWQYGHDVFSACLRRGHIIRGRVIISSHVNCLFSVYVLGMSYNGLLSAVASNEKKWRTSGYSWAPLTA